MVNRFKDLLQRIRTGHWFNSCLAFQFGFFIVAIILWSSGNPSAESFKRIVLGYLFPYALLDPPDNIVSMLISCYQIAMFHSPMLFIYFYITFKHERIKKDEFLSKAVPVASFAITLGWYALASLVLFFSFLSP